MAYDLLRTRGTQAAAEAVAFSLRAFLDDRTTAQSVLAALRPLRKVSNDGIERLFGSAAPKHVRFKRIARLLPWVILAGAGVCTVSLYGLALVAVYIVGAFVLQSRLYAELAAFSQLEDEIRVMLATAVKVSEVPLGRSHILLVRLKDDDSQAWSVLKLLDRARALSGIPEAEEYANWLSSQYQAIFPCASPHRAADEFSAFLLPDTG